MQIGGQKNIERKWKNIERKIMRKYLIYTLGFIFAVSMLVSVIMYGLHVWAIQG